MAYWLALRNTSDNVEVTGTHRVCTRIRLSATYHKHITQLTHLLLVLTRGSVTGAVFLSQESTWCIEWSSLTGVNAL